MAENQVSLRILTPEGTVNYIKNPSFRYDTSGWDVQGATLTRTLERARFGVSGGQVVTNGAALHEGVLYRVSALDGISDNVTVSVYVRGQGTVRIRLDDNAVGGGEYVSQPVRLNDRRWTRLSVSGRCHGGDDIRLVVETDEAAAFIRTFYIDGAQLERKPYATSYCDGDQEKCRWQGLLHGSISERPEGTRAGGTWVELSGPKREAENLYMTNAGGLGIPPLTNSVQDYALAPGGYHQGVKVNMRQITFTFHAKRPALFYDKPLNLDKLHALRQFLIDTVKSDLTAGDEDIWFEYQDGDVPLYFRARYDGGLEGDWDVRNGFVNSFPLRLLAVSPFFSEDSQDAQELDFQDVINPYFVLGRVDGQWNILNYGVDDIAYRFALGKRQDLYLVGGFMTVNNNAAAEDPLRTSRYITYWDGDKWNALGNGLGLSNTTLSVDVAPNGYIYRGGNSVGLTAANTTYWDGSAWNNMDAGTDNIVYAVRAASDGNIYYAGAFTQAGALNCYRVARWDGSQWHRLGQFGGLNDQVIYMAVAPDAKKLVVAGDFTDQQGFAANALYNIAQYDTETGQFSAMGGNATDLINGPLLYTRAGVVYAWGFPETLNGATVYNLARWTGAAWEKLGGALSVQPNAMFEAPNGDIILAGAFIKSGSVPVSKIAKWNGSSVVPLDIYMPEGNTQDVRVLDNGDIYCADFLQEGDNVLVAHINTVNNRGTLSAPPVFYAAGPGRLVWLENQTTGKTLYFNLYIFPNEEVTIDIPARRIYSNTRGNLLEYLLPGSDFGDFILAPGNNRIACLMYDDVNARLSIQHTPSHWSADASAQEGV